jgi:hypothetical protein
MAEMLESWNDGTTKSAITDFIGRVTETAGAEQALEVAGQQNWTVVSIKNDWNTVFADAT